MEQNRSNVGTRKPWGEEAYQKIFLPISVYDERCLRKEDERGFYLQVALSSSTALNEESPSCHPCNSRIRFKARPIFPSHCSNCLRAPARDMGYDFDSLIEIGIDWSLDQYPNNHVNNLACPHYASTGNIRLLESFASVMGNNYGAMVRVKESGLC